MQKITTCLWFDRDAEEAANFYVSLFKDSRIIDVKRYGETGPGPVGTAMLVTFELQGQQFQALNGANPPQFNESVSLSVSCDDQAEVNELWDRLGEGGQYQQCGWLKDRYGVAWQIVPAELPRLLDDPDPVKVDRVMAAMLRMGKLDIAGLRQAYQGD